MRYSRFLLSFTATALLVTPLALNAKAPPGFNDVKVAPAPGQSAVVNGVAFHSTIIKQDGKRITFRVDAKNDTDAAIDTKVAASLMMRPATSPMARMVRPPLELAANPIRVTLAPGQQYSRTFTVKLPANVVGELAAAKAPAPNSNKINNLRMAMQPPSFFTRVRPVAKPVTAQAQPAPQPQPVPQAQAQAPRFAQPPPPLAKAN